jgi:peroxiredoxin
LNAVGNAMQLRGQDFQNRPIDLSERAYRGKVVLIHYWATWSTKCKEDMVLLKDFYTKNRGRDFEIIGVCLDSSAAPARQFLDQNRFPWRHVYEPGGADGRLANEMGVMTLPLMLLVDPTGRVANNNVQVAELDAEFARLAKPAAGPANALRNAPSQR